MQYNSEVYDIILNQILCQIEQLERKNFERAMFSSISLEFLCFKWIFPEGAQFPKMYE